jgi:type III secretion protein J
MTPRSSLRPLALSLAFLALTGCTIELQHDLTEQDANDIYVLLSESGIPTQKHKEEGGNEPRYLITVNKSDAAQAAKLLREHALPRPHKEGLGVFVRIKGMVPTQTEERGIMLQALGGEVANVLNKVDGVLAAEAVISLPEVTDLTQPENKPLPAASIFVKYRPGVDGKPPLSEEQVKRFASRAVQELRPEAVEVLMTPSLPTNLDMGPEGRMQEVMGLQMTAGSATTFKMMAAGALLLIVALAGALGWSLTRSPQAPARPRQRPAA